MRCVAVILRPSIVTQSANSLDETLTGRAFALPTLRYCSFIWNDQTAFASALIGKRNKDTVTGKIDQIRRSLTLQFNLYSNDMETIAKGVGRIRECLTDDLLLNGEHARLEPMTIDHIDGLIEAATDGKLWELEYTVVPDKDSMRAMVEHALKRKASGKEFPFVVRLAESGKVVGTTRYYYINEQCRNLSIGYTWYSQSTHRTGVNTECKYMLLTLAFEKMGCISVQWHTDHRNKRSQAAIMRLGAQFEGILRNDKIMPNGVIRHTHCFSMLDTEWSDCKAFLESRLIANG